MVTSRQGKQWFAEVTPLRVRGVTIFRDFQRRDRLVVMEQLEVMPSLAGIEVGAPQLDAKFGLHDPFVRAARLG